MTWLGHDRATMAGHEALRRSTLLPPSGLDGRPGVALTVSTDAGRCRVSVCLGRTSVEECADHPRLAGTDSRTQVVEFGGRKRPGQLLVLVEVGESDKTVECATT